MGTADLAVPLQCLGELFRVLTGKAARSAQQAQEAVLSWMDAFPLLEQLLGPSASWHRLGAVGLQSRPKTCSEFYNRSTHWSDWVMAHRVLAETTVSISELKKNPMATVAAGDGMPVAVLNRNEPAFYCVPAKAYEELMDLVDDLELGRIADARLTDGQEPVRVSLDAL